MKGPSRRVSCNIRMCRMHLFWLLQTIYSNFSEETSLKRGFKFLIEIRSNGILL